MYRVTRGRKVANVVWAVVCLGQILVAVLAAAVAGLRGGELQALAALYGGVIAVIPSVYMALRMFSAGRGQAPAQLAVAFYRGEFGKLVLTALLFWSGVVLFSGAFLSLMLSYIASLVVYWLAMPVLWSERWNHRSISE